MKKKYIPMGFTIIGYGLIFLAIAGISTYIIISSLKTIFVVIAALMIALSLFFFVCPLISYIIKIEGKEISIKKDFGLFKEDRVQSKEKVNLEEIKEYKVILSDRNSKGEPYKGNVPKKKYIEFTLNDDSTSRFYVSTLAKKQLLKLLDNIKELSGKEVTIK